MRNNTATDVNLASQTHHVPHIGLPHKDPVNIQINVKVAPIGAKAELTINPKGILKASAIILYMVITNKVNIANHAEGT